MSNLRGISGMFVFHLIIDIYITNLCTVSSMYYAFQRCTNMISRPASSYIISNFTYFPFDFKDFSSMNHIIKIKNIKKNVK